MCHEMSRRHSELYESKEEGQSIIDERPTIVECRQVHPAVPKAPCRAHRMKLDSVAAIIIARIVLMSRTGSCQDSRAGSFTACEGRGSGYSDVSEENR